ncbi:MAG TPA: hypothetical protein VJ770_00720 [Stellaceae bacterium]|nr:hypothetical protein [Stellaceae bacterium]
MRADMSRVIVERPRRGGVHRKGRAQPIESLPQCEGIGRPYRISGGYKVLNENLAPLRRYLERQVGRPWNTVYAEIAAHLRAGSAVQQHVRDHIGDFVAVKPRRRNGPLFAYPDGDRRRFSELWRQPLYVDERDGILKRTDRLPEEQARLRARRNPPPRPLDRIALAPDRELRLIDGFWYELRLAPMPDPVYQAVVERRQVPLKPFRRRSPLVEVAVTVRRLAGPFLRDAATGKTVEIAPEVDDPRAWSEYRRRHPDRRYAVAKRRLGKAELRRHGLRDHAPEDGPLD